MVGKEGNAVHQHFLLFPQCFSKFSSSWSLKCMNVWLMGYVNLDFCLICFQKKNAFSFCPSPVIIFVINLQKLTFYSISVVTDYLSSYRFTLNIGMLSIKRVTHTRGDNCQLFFTHLCPFFKREITFKSQAHASERRAIYSGAY